MDIYAPEKPLDVRHKQLRNVIGYIEAGITEKGMIDNLKEDGYIHSDAIKIISEARTERVVLLKKSSFKIVRNGLIWFLSGMVLTIIGIIISTEYNSSYFLFWGAIGYGAYQLIKGVRQYLKVCEVHKNA